MDTAQWAQGIGVVKKPMDESSSCGGTAAAATMSMTSRPLQPQPGQDQQQQRRARPLREQALNCPRCNSTNTKFCYYNNYSLTQPRYFCKTCRRYWTEGGSLRNVPVGGGSRKNKRHSSSGSTTTSSSSTKNTVNNSNPQFPQSSMAMHGIAAATMATTSPLAMPLHIGAGQDLNLGFASSSLPELIGGFPSMDSATNTSGGLSAMELLRSTGISTRGLGFHMPMPGEAGGVYGAASGFGLHEFGSAAAPGMKYSMDGINGGNDNGAESGMQENGRLLFPFGDFKPPPVATAKAMAEENEQQENRGVGRGDHGHMFWSTGSNLDGGGGGSW